MRVITWNCNLKFKEKFALVDSYAPDICFIQECEKLKSDFFPNYKYFWTGRNESKGLGVLTKGNDFFKDWFGNNNEKCVVAGDFNNSIIWDKKGNDNNFDNINNNLMNLGFVSNYHKQKEEVFGKESTATFFHTKKESKKYHIDYIYSKNLSPVELEVGSYSEWIGYSDHSPLIVEMISS